MGEVFGTKQEQPKYTQFPAKSHVFVTATQHHFMNTFWCFFFVPEESWSKKLGGSHLPFWTEIRRGGSPPQFAGRSTNTEAFVGDPVQIQTEKSGSQRG